MRKLLATLLTISLNAYAIPPVSVDSEVTAVGNYVQNVKLPNEQATQLTSRNTRVETGNTNLLKNPSFEHMTTGLGWTTTNATSALETSAVVDGKKSLKLTLSGALTATQDSSINAANLVGLQGVASIKIKSSNVSGLKVCARNAGVTSTSLCVNVTADGTWKHVSIPFIMTATSNGIAITSTGTSGIVYIDDAFVGTSAPFQSVNGAKLVGTVKATGCAAQWTVTSTSYAAFGTQTGCTYTTTGQLQAPSTNIPGFKVASLPAGDYRIEYEGGLNSSTNVVAYFQFTDGTNTAREESQVVGTASSNWVPGASQSISYSTTQSNVTFQMYGKSASSAIYMNGTTLNPGVFKLWYFPPESRIYSQAQDTVEFIEHGAGSSSWGSTNTGVPILNITKNTNRGILQVLGDSTTGTYFKALKDCEVNIAANMISNAGGADVMITRNATTLTASIFNDSTVVALSSAIAASYNNQISANINLAAGDILRIQRSGTSITGIQRATITATVVNPTIVGSFAGYTQNSDMPSASYYLSSNFTSSSSIPFNFDGKEWDNCNPSCVTTSSTAWKFTAPFSAVYNVSVYTNMTGGTSTAIQIYKNGSLLKTISSVPVNGVASAASFVRLLKGDYIDIRSLNSNTFIGGSLVSNGVSNISIGWQAAY